MQTTIAFISYPVTNLDRAVEFYQKALGKEPLFHREDWAEFELGGQRLALNKSSSINGIGATVYFLAQPIEDFILSKCFRLCWIASLCFLVSIRIEYLLAAQIETKLLYILKSIILFKYVSVVLKKLIASSK